MWTGPRWRWCGSASGSSFASPLWFECCGLFPVETGLRPTKLIKLQLPSIHQLLTNPSPSPGCKAWLCRVPSPTATPYSDICEAFYKAQWLAACRLLAAASPMPCCWCSQASPLPPSLFSQPIFAGSKAVGLAAAVPSPAAWLWPGLGRGAACFCSPAALPGTCLTSTAVHSSKTLVQSFPADFNVEPRGF